ncbi:MAG: glycine--tRNA ligase subunit beta [Saccharospirillaceae bacterium]|nr:glycine--tRNA ligase subunit beta [Pseudomonadales bacterium]NRB78817.1 glycine--tRNA ligase subunit beta [Saccharospirillaceae bacterium]
MAQKDYLIELGTEELPPKSLKKLRDAFLQSFETQLKASGLEFDSVQAFAAPRRLGLLFKNLDDTQKDLAFERKGPSKKAAFDESGEPTKALLGFMRGAGCTVEDLVTIDTPKGEWLMYQGMTKGKATNSLLPAMLDKALTQLPIAKRMRWGARRDEFVRPIQWLVFLEGSEIIETEVMGVQSSNTSRGHRFHCNQDIKITNPNDYEVLLEKAYVITNYEKRQDIIKTGAQKVAADKGVNVIIHDDLLDEVTSLNEWPVALMGQFEEEFLQVPQEALISSMNEHQKYFHTENEQGQIQPNFVFIANIESKNPQIVIEGNEKVIRPRLADAKFFWDTDKKTPLIDRLEKLKSITFQKQLGTLFNKVERISNIASQIAVNTHADLETVQTAAKLIKSDLTCDMVFEFTDLQGIAGSYYAKHDGWSDEISASINEHYLPKFAGDELPATPTGITLAIADRMDTIVGLFGIGQPPTGTKDPYALRRAALGVLRILVGKNVEINLHDLIKNAYEQFDNLPQGEAVIEQVYQYMLDRFSAWYADENVAPSVFQAVRAINPQQPCDINLRVQAVNEFLQIAEAKDLAAANKRVSNILAKVKDLPSQDVNEALLTEKAEKDLYQAIIAKQTTVTKSVNSANYSAALNELASLRDSIDAFFESVMVNHEDDLIRFNRLALLTQLRQLFLQVADISVLQF